MKLYITSKAKEQARKALLLRASLPEYKKFGLSESEAKKQGIASGVARANQLIEKTYYDWNDPEDREDLKSMAGFYSRFQNCRTPKCEGSMSLWGGRYWLRYDVLPFVRKVKG